MKKKFAFSKEQLEQYLKNHAEQQIKLLETERDDEHLMDLEEL